MAEQNFQTTSRILMVRPHRFVFNPATSGSNAFQRQAAPGEAEKFEKLALEEFDRMVTLLRENDVEVIVKQDTPQPPKPDAVFPNNWIMFHHSGDISIFPMEAENRRNERRMDIIDDLREDFVVQSINDFSGYEVHDKFLEGTGSMIFDHRNRVGYACISSRTDADLFNEFCGQMKYEPQSFSAFDKNGRRIYHTNVIMCVGKEMVVLCVESIRDEEEKERITNRIADSGLELIDISLKQMNQFAGNMLQLTNSRAEELLVMSSRAFESLTPRQVAAIEKYCRIVHTPLTTIENLGGGSARCMMAEVFLPRKA